MSEDAQEQVNAFLEILHSRYGISERDVAGLLRQLARLQQRTAFAQRMGEFTAKSIIGVLVVAFFSGLGWTVIHFIGSIKHG